MAEKRYAFIGTYRIEVPTHCQVCNLDVSADLRTSHIGRCSQCLEETEHVIPYPGAPWHCAEAHADDDTVCCVCDAELPQQEGPVTVITREVQNFPKRMCRNCDPLRDYKPGQ